MLTNGSSSVLPVYNPSSMAASQWRDQMGRTILFYDVYYRYTIMLFVFTPMIKTRFLFNNISRGKLMYLHNIQRLSTGSDQQTLINSKINLTTVL